MSVTEGFGYNANNNQMSSHKLTVNHGTAANGSVSYTHNSLGRLSTVSRSRRSWGSVLLIIFYVENLDVGSWGVKNDV